MPSGEQVALQPTLAGVLGEDLHHPAVDGEVVVVRHGLGVPGPVGHLEDVLEAVGVVLIRGEQPEVVHVACHHVAQERAQHPGGLHGTGAGCVDVDGVVAEVGHLQVPQKQSPVGVRVGAHPTLPSRVQGRDLRHRRAVGVEELLGLVAAHPLLEHLCGASRCRAHRRTAPGGSASSPRSSCRRAPWVRSSPSGNAARSSATADAPPAPSRRAVARASAWISRISSRQWSRVAANAWCISVGVRALDDVRRVPVTAHERGELVLADPGEHGGVGDLVAVEVQDRQHGAVAALGR